MNETRTYEYLKGRTELGARAYNLCIGISVFIGLLITAVTTYLLKDSVGMMFYAHPLIFSILYLVVSLSASQIAINTENEMVSVIGHVVIAIATGALLSSCIPYEKMSVLLNAAITTGVILAVMITVATAFPGMFLGFGKVLLTSLFALIIGETIMYFIFGVSPAIIDVIAIGIFTVYIGYDWQKGLEYPKTLKFAIITTISIYLDLINIFIRLVSLTSKNSNKK